MLFWPVTQYTIMNISVNNYSNEIIKVGIGHASQSIQCAQNSHVLKLSGCDEILQSDWSWWNSTIKTKLWIGLIPDLLLLGGWRRPTRQGPG